MPALYLGHGAPPLLDDPSGRTARILGRFFEAPGSDPHGVGTLERAHSASRRRPPCRSCTTSGLSRALLQARLPIAWRSGAGRRVRELLAGCQPIAESPGRGLDHGAFIPLMCMWPEADVPVLQISMPNLRAEALLETGRQLAPLRDEDVLIIGSGFLTHGLPFIDPTRPDNDPPAWSAEFDAWAAESIALRTSTR